MPLPAATFTKTNVVVGNQCILEITPPGAEPVAILFLVNNLAERPNLTISRHGAPGANNGPEFTARTWVQARGEAFAIRTSEVKKVLTLLGGMSGHRTGDTAKFYVRDQTDANGKVALVSDAFPCSIYRDPTEAAFSPATPAEVTIVVESLKDGPVTWTPDADT